MMEGDSAASGVLLEGNDEAVECRDSQGVKESAPAELKDVTFHVMNMSGLFVNSEELKLRCHPGCCLESLICEELGCSSQLAAPFMVIQTEEEINVACDYDDLDSGGSYILKLFPSEYKYSNYGQLLCRRHRSISTTADTEADETDKAAMVEASDETTKEERIEDKETLMKRKVGTLIGINEGYRNFQFPFVGREKEIDILTALLGCSTSPQLIVIAQQPGSGKSRFAVEFRNRSNMLMIFLTGYQLKNYFKVTRRLDLAVVECIFDLIKHISRQSTVTDCNVENKYKWIRQVLENCLHQQSLQYQQQKRLILVIEGLGELETLFGTTEQLDEYAGYLDQCYQMYRQLFRIIFSLDLFHVIASGESRSLLLNDLSNPYSIWHGPYQFHSLYLPPLTMSELSTAIQTGDLKGVMVTDILADNCGVRNVKAFIHDIFVITTGIPILAENVIRALLINQYKWNTEKHRERRRWALLEFCMNHSETVFDGVNVGNNRPSVIDELCEMAIERKPIKRIVISQKKCQTIVRNFYGSFVEDEDGDFRVHVPPLLIFKVLNSLGDIRERLTPLIATL